MASKTKGYSSIAEDLPIIMRRLFGGGLITSGIWELTIAQLRALNFAAERPGGTMGELSESLGIRLSAATGLADRLVQHGLLKRDGDPSDRRVIRLHLTPAGRRAQGACKRERKRRVEAALQRLSAKEQDKIAAALAILRKALETEAA